MRVATVVLTVAIAAGCASQPEPTSVPCTPAAQWSAAASGAPLGGCPDDDAIRSARFLGEQYRGLAEELAALEAIDGAGELTGAQRIDQVRIIGELDQIRGAAIVNGWEPMTDR